MKAALLLEGGFLYDAEVAPIVPFFCPIGAKQTACLRILNSSEKTDKFCFPQKKFHFIEERMETFYEYNDNV